MPDLLPLPVQAGTVNAPPAVAVSAPEAAPAAAPAPSPFQVQEGVVPQVTLPGTFKPSPEELAKAIPAAQASNVFTPTPEELKAATPAPQPFHPLRDLSVDELVNQAKTNPEFDPISLYQESDPATKSDPAIWEKTRDSLNKLQQQGLFSGITAGGIAKSAIQTGKGLAASGFNLGTALGYAIRHAPETIKTLIAGQVPKNEFGAGFEEQAQKQYEAAAGTEVGLLGLGQMAARAPGILARHLGLTKQPQDFTPEEKDKALVAELASRGAMARAAKGPLPEVAQALAERGFAPRPEKISEAAAGSPFVWAGMGKAFEAAGTATKAATAPVTKFLGESSALPLSAQAIETIPAPAAAGDLAAKAFGTALQAGGVAVEKPAALVEKLAESKAVKGAMRVAGPVLGMHHGGLGGGALGVAAEQILERVPGLAEKAGAGVSKLGEQIAGKAPITSDAAQILKAAAEASPNAAAQLGQGAAFDFGLMAATTDKPSDRAGFIPFGTTFGAVGGAKATGSRVLSGLIIAPRSTESSTIVPSTLNFPSLANLHDSNFASAADGIRQRVNAVRGFAKQVAPSSEVFVLPKGPDAATALTKAGLPAEWAQQNGFFSKQIVGADGRPHNVIVATDLNSAPHEVIHGMDDVLGADGVQALNDAAKQEAQSKGNWDSIRQSYTNRLAGEAVPPDQIDSTVLTKTNRGDAAAIEKLTNGVRNDLSNELGRDPTAAELKDAATPVVNRAQAEADSAGKQLWEMQLTPEEQKLSADNYFGSEIRAENGDAWFKAGQDPKTLAGKMALATAHLVSFFGGEPLVGRYSEVGQFPLAFKTVRGVAGEAKAVKGATPTVQAAPVVLPKTRGAGVPATPEQQQTASQEAQQVAAVAPDAPLSQGATQTGKDMMGGVAEAIRGQGGLEVDYHTAPGEPAAFPLQNRTQRRSLIDAARELPNEARQLFKRVVYPYRVFQTKTGKYQVGVWSPEIFAANAHRLAKSLNEAILKNPGLAQAVTDKIPYELNQPGRSFSTAGWQKLHSDLQVFIRNQARGLTGAGEKLVIPKSAMEAGVTAPLVTGEAGEALPQANADVINMLFGLGLPKTARVSTGELKVPANVAAQDISAATKAGRVIQPATPRGVYATGEAAGRSVMEVNPTRDWVETTTKGAGVEVPSMIETMQRLNMDRVKSVRPTTAEPPFKANTLTLQAGFQPRTPVEIEGPDGKKYKATHDGYQDFSSIGAGIAPQFTALEDMSAAGGPVKGSTTYGPSLEKKGFKLPTNVPTPEEHNAMLAAENRAALQAPEAQFQAKPKEEDKTKLIHYSTVEGLKTLEPEFHGTGVAGAEAARKRDYPELYVPRTYLGTKGYEKEGALGDVRYKAEVRSGKLYNIEEDPKGLYPSSSELEAAGYAPMDQRAALSMYEKRIHDAGYEGYLSPSNNAVAKFTPTPVKQLKPGEAAFQPKQLVTPEREKQFKTSKVRFDDGTLKPVFHATVEDFPMSEMRTAGFKAHFGTPDQAASRVLGPERERARGAMDTGGALANTHPVFLDIKNPLRMDDVGSWDQAYDVAMELARRRVKLPRRLNQDINQTIQNEVYRVMGTESDEATPTGVSEDDAYKQANEIVLNELQDQVKRAGYDGVVYKNDYESPAPELRFERKSDFLSYPGQEDYYPPGEQTSDSYIAFDPKQIHPAITQKPEAQFLPKPSEEIEKRLADASYLTKDEQGKPKPFFHGSGSSDDLSRTGYFDPGKQDREALAGPGFYFTDDPKIASGYAEGAEKKAPGVAPVFLDVKNPFNIDKPLNNGRDLALSLDFKRPPMPEIAPEVRAEVDRVLREGRPESRSHADMYVDNDRDIYRVLSERGELKNESPSDTVASYLDRAFFSKAKIRRAIEGQISQMTDGTTWYDRMGHIVGKKALNEALERAGYDAIAHTGGKNTGNEPHQVIVAFKPEQIYGALGGEQRKIPGAEAQFQAAKGSLDEDIKTSRQFWITNKGVTHPAWAGHQQSAEDVILPDTFVPNLPKALRLSDDSRADAVYSEMRKQGNIRGVAMSNPDYLDLNGIPHNQLSVPAQKEIQRLSQSLELPVRYNGRDIDTGIAFPEAQFQAPAAEDFKDETKIGEALKQPNWAIFTATQEALGPGTNAVNEKANAQLEQELKDAGFEPVEVKGYYKGVDQGKNFLVPGMTQAEAQEWGNKFKQESVLTNKGLIYNDDTVSPVNPANTVIGKDAKGLDFYSQVPGGPAFSMGVDFARRIPLQRKQQSLLGGEEKYPLTTKQVGEMSAKDLRDYYPEAVVPNKVRNRAGELVDPLIGSDIVNAPLIKGMSRPEAVKTYAAKLVEEAKKWTDNPAFQDGLKWYSEFTPELKRVYGADAQIMAELLAATSPNNAPDTNFAFANDALEGLRSGRFDKQIKKFEDGLEKVKDGSWEKWIAKEDPQGVQSEAHFLEKWTEKYNLRPKQSNGKLYGMHSDAVLQVFARKWLEQTTGPKTQNFIKNLVGTGHEATIDVWADRTMRRLGYQDANPRWRILPKNSTGVSDADFALSQEVFREAAKQLGVQPDALQGGMWFAEKKHWADNAWGRLDLGDYRKEISKVPMLKSGIQQRLAAQKAQAKAKPMEQAGFDLVTPAPPRRE